LEAVDFLEAVAAAVEDAAAAGVEDAEFDSPRGSFLPYIRGTFVIRRTPLPFFGTTTVPELVPGLELELLHDDDIGPLSFFCGFNPQKKLRLSPI
jgi:hypothetical protein